MLIKRVQIIAIIVFALVWSCACVGQHSAHSASDPTDDSAITRAFKTRKSNVQVQGEGVVERILKDDVEGSRHQRFIVRVAADQTVLIAHNIDIAPRVDNLLTGDTISFAGEYVWNEQGGVVHWTHHDPEGKHVTGWIKYKGKTYQ